MQGLYSVSSSTVQALVCLSTTYAWLGDCLFLTLQCYFLLLNGRPMFKLCKSRRMDEGILTKLNRIVSFCLQEEFVKAHDTYIDISIGRAAWPIGVTMVGIHARTGRAKIESSNVAHVMNSELQRKYLTSVKRLMTYAQKKSSADPSKKVL